MDKFSDLKKRILSSILLLIIVILFFVGPNLISYIILFCASGILLYEWWQCAVHKTRFVNILTLLYVLLGCLAFILLNFLRFSLPDQGGVFLLWVIFIAIMTDTGGYFVGRIFGGARPFVNISPGKTISGYIGGLILGISAPIIIFLLMGIQQLSVQKILFLGGIGFLLSLSSIGGDLFQSYFKRFNGVKDSGTILPGHGGLFDRLDAMLGGAIALCFMIFLHNFLI